MELFLTKKNRRNCNILRQLHCYHCPSSASLLNKRNALQTLSFGYGWFSLCNIIIQFTAN